ncbi:MAG: DNA-processing protein DprA [Candidatus Krumholzibacteriia bacterium]|nr:DNA-protecting protein DprA [Candidatus Latescibacterota bacterium]
MSLRPRRRLDGSAQAHATTRDADPGVAGAALALSGRRCALHPDVDQLELSQRLLYQPARLAELVALGTPPPRWLEILRREPAPQDLPSPGVLRGQAETCRRLDIRVSPFGGADYPAALGQLPDPPPLLYYRGRLPGEGEPLLAIVGSRRASGQGLEMARRLGRAAAAAGRPVVSGLARGIDQAAQRGSLEQGPSWGVLGCGLDRVYPPEAGALAEAVVAAGGLLSEFPPGAPPLPFHFPRRNRLIAALGVALVVVEAGSRSGALHTARESQALGRELGAVPASPLNPSAGGSNRLLAEGCHLLLGPEDLPVLWGESAGPGHANGETWTPARCAREGVLDAERLSARSGWLITETLERLADWEREGAVERLGGGRFRVTDAAAPAATIDGGPRVD